MNILWRYVMAYWDYYGVEYKMSLTSMIVRRLSSHIINCSLTHSLTHSINRSINRWIQRYVTHIKFHIILWPQGKCPADLRAYLSEIQWLLINTFLLIRYCCKLPRYICFIQPCWTKKISGICIIRIISIMFFSELRLTSNATFKFECIGFLFLLFYRTIKCRCLLCLEVWTCSLLAVV